MKRHYVYKITNTITNCYYIGKRSHENPDEDTYMGSGKLIKQAIHKHGREHFKKEIIEVFDTHHEALCLEAKLVTIKEVQDPMCYNMHEGGKGGFAHINCEPIGKRVNLLSCAKKRQEGQMQHVGGQQNWSEECKSAAKIRCELNRIKYRHLAYTAEAQNKKRETYKHIQHQQGVKNSQFGTVWCVEYNAEDCKKRKKFKHDSIPCGWISTKEWKENRKNKTKSNYGKHWYNDGINNFLLTEEDDRTTTLNKGRIMIVNLKQ